MVAGSADKLAHAIDTGEDESVAERHGGRDAVAESAEWLELLRSKVMSVDSAEIDAVLSQKNAVESSRLMRKLIGGTQ